LIKGTGFSFCGFDILLLYKLLYLAYFKPPVAKREGMFFESAVFRISGYQSAAGHCTNRPIPLFHKDGLFGKQLQERADWSFEPETWMMTYKYTILKMK
jgi:hypothetical protein